MWVKLFTSQKEQALFIDNGDVYLDSCNIIGENKGITVTNESGVTGNKLYISNSRVTGEIDVTSGNNVYLGVGMDSITTEQKGENVDSDTYKTVSFKGRDK